jgi:drug/metabolite transporter (DMT)-like permease
MFNPSSPRRGLLIALPVVWILFGSAYVALKVGVAVVPPFLFAGSRFVLAGAILLAVCAIRARGRLGLRWRHLGEAALAGGGMFLLGQGAATWASTQLDAGVVAVLISTVALWSGVLAWAFLGTRLTLVTGAGLALGFVGVVVLAAPAGGHFEVAPLVALVVGSISFASATLFGVRSELGRRPILLSSLEMLFGGAMQLVLATLLGEPARFHPAAVTPAVVIAFAVVALSGLVGFSLFTWVAQRAGPAVANSQAYMAPVVTLLLGWMVLQEPLGARTLVASVVILAGVALLVAGQPRRRPAVVEEPVEEREAA